GESFCFSEFLGSLGERLEVAAVLPGGPGDAGELVGQGDRCLVVSNASLELERPGPEAIVFLRLLSVAENGPRSVDQEHTDVGVSALGDATEPALHPARVFPGGEPEVAREVAAGGETVNVADEGNEGGGDQEPNPRNRPQQIHHGGLLRDRLD